MDCIECNNEIKGYGKKFCSRSCSVTYNNKLVSKRTGKEVVKLYCKQCQKELNLSVGQKSYCSHSCGKKHQRAMYIESWKCGNENGSSGQYSLSRHIRQYLFEKYDNKCCQCGWNTPHPVDGKIPLEVDHIDGDYTNNKEDNLRLICPNCHSLTPTYRNRNKSGRKGREVYYNKLK